MLLIKEIFPELTPPLFSIMSKVETPGLFYFFHTSHFMKLISSFDFNQKSIILMIAKPSIS